MSILDMLSQIVEKQVNFQKFLGYTIPVRTEEIISRENINFLILQILSLYDETSEALQCLPWKPWKKKQTFLLEPFWEELMDIFHFVVNMCIFTGMSSEMIFTKFMEKNRINWERQKHGY